MTDQPCQCPSYSCRAPWHKIVPTVRPLNPSKEDELDSCYERIYQREQEINWLREKVYQLETTMNLNGPRRPRIRLVNPTEP